MGEACFINQMVKNISTRSYLLFIIEFNRLLKYFLNLNSYLLLRVKGQIDVCHVTSHNYELSTNQYLSSLQIKVTLGSLYIMRKDRESEERRNGGTPREKREERK